MRKQRNFSNGSDKILNMVAYKGDLHHLEKLQLKLNLPLGNLLKWVSSGASACFWLHASFPITSCNPCWHKQSPIGSAKFNLSMWCVMELAWSLLWDFSWSSIWSSLLNMPFSKKRSLNGTGSTCFTNILKSCWKSLLSEAQLTWPFSKTEKKFNQNLITCVEILESDLYFVHAWTTVNFQLCWRITCTIKQHRSQVVWKFLLNVKYFQFNWPIALTANPDPNFKQLW